MQLVYLVALIILSACLPGCGTSKSEAPVREFTLRGEVLRLDAAQRIATIRHDEIEGWMEAMTMDFPVREGEDLSQYSTGRRIEATLYVQDLAFYIGNVRPQPASQRSK